jgi:polysaccharide pyruvyl transferase WcaK-like protein
VYRKLFSKNNLLSVRDRYTEQRLIEIGVKNVIYTACPTMWELSPEFCKEIPITKAENVITTLTHYKRDVGRDRTMLNILLACYSKVFFFAQQADDIAYLKELGFSERVEIIKPSLAAFDNILRFENVDFVGTRLHAGIRALNFKRRSLIIAVDNRATEIKKDTNLPVLLSDEISSLQELIYSKIHLDILLPNDSIRRWKSQFV